MTIPQTYQLIKQYYGSLFEFLGQPPMVSLENIDQLAAIEAKYNIILPDAVKAWYSIEGWLGILKDYSSFDYIDSVVSFFNGGLWNDVTQSEVTETEYQQVQLYNKWSTENKLISVFGEHQGMIQWYFLMENESDPKVRVYLEAFPYALLPYPNTFSEMVYLNIWDAKLLGYWLKGYTGHFSGQGDWDKQLTFLEQHFTPLPTTDLTKYVGRKIYRFEKEGMLVAYWKATKPSLKLYATKRDTYQQLLNVFIENDVFISARKGLVKELNNI